MRANLRTPALVVSVVPELVGPAVVLPVPTLVLGALTVVDRSA